LPARPLRRHWELSSCLIVETVASSCALHIPGRWAYIGEIELRTRLARFLGGGSNLNKPAWRKIAAGISVEHQEEEIAMARLIFAVLTLAAAVLIQPRSGQAAPYWPWCSSYWNSGNVRQCAFSSWEQCMDTVRGIGGYCYTNPYGPPPAPERSVRSHRRIARY